MMPVILSHLIFNKNIDRFKGSNFTIGPCESNYLSHDDKQKWIKKENKYRNRKIKIRFDPVQTPSFYRQI